MSTEDLTGEMRQRASEALVGFSKSLAANIDLKDLLHDFTEQCARMLDASEVSLLVSSPGGDLRVVASSRGDMETLGLFESHDPESPSTHVLEHGEPVLNVRILKDNRWPKFETLAAAAGFKAVHVLPLRHGREIMGTMDVFEAGPIPLDPTGARLVQALADLAAFAIAQERALHRATELAAQLQQALESRIVIEQAKGVLAERLKMDMTEAFGVLRRYSRNRSARISQVAANVVERRLSADDLVAGARVHRHRGSPSPMN